MVTSARSTFPLRNWIAASAVSSRAVWPSSPRAENSSSASVCSIWARSKLPSAMSPEPRSLDERCVEVRSCDRDRSAAAVHPASRRTAPCFPGAWRWMRGSGSPAPRTACRRAPAPARELRDRRARPARIRRARLRECSSQAARRAHRCAIRSLRKRPARAVARLTAVSSMRALFLAQHLRAHPRRQVELVERAQDRGACLAGRIIHCGEMSLRRFGGPAAIGKLVQQVEFDGAALIFAFCQRLHVVCRREMRRGLRAWARSLRATRRDRFSPAVRWPCPAPETRANAGRAGHRVRAAASAGCVPRPLRASCAGRCWPA